MGQHLSEPVTTKETSGSANSNYRCASSSMQGWRISIFSKTYKMCMIASIYIYIYIRKIKDIFIFTERINKVSGNNLLVTYFNFWQKRKNLNYQSSLSFLFSPKRI